MGAVLEKFSERIRKGPGTMAAAASPKLEGRRYETAQDVFARRRREAAANGAEEGKNGARL
jgi:hypothetical protein